MAQWVKCFLLKHDLNLDFQDPYNQSVVVCIYNPSAGGGAGGGNGDWGWGRRPGWRLGAGQGWEWRLGARQGAGMEETETNGSPALTACQSRQISGSGLVEDLVSEIREAGLER